jgi:nitroimidazol reductase NimA-like FMN-containing flavoprotein (pyridoxamine 5'-phosphate oxidase superfamily)
MVEDLVADTIDTLLHEEVIARIAYVDRRGVPSIAPIAYAYDGRAFYGYSLLGAKIEGMQANPQVCVEVDHVRDPAEWWSVVAHGVFEPLSGEAAADAVRMISDRLRTVTRAAHVPEAHALTYVGREGALGIAYRIRVIEKHGRSSSSG